jgi:hypothetical protein
VNVDIQAYIQRQPEEFRGLCELLAAELSKGLPESESKIWHGHPVWFLDGNPICGFSLEKSGLRLMFWSGADFEEADLKPGTGKFKDASIFYQPDDTVDLEKLQTWLKKSQYIQWDYKNIVKHKGHLDKLSIENNKESL